VLEVYSVCDPSWSDLSVLVVESCSVKLCIMQKFYYLKMLRM
jgi:hypothetical protein